MRYKRLVRLLLTFMLVSLPVIGFMQRQPIYDWARLRNYQPPAEVIRLADVTTMNDTMRRIFYVYHPGIENKATFNQNCRDNEQTIVLGCYVHREGIHLLDVSDSRLAGVEEVTAAHESLHAAYARLSNTERNKVDSMTAAAVAVLKDTRVTDTIELYRKQDPKIVPNELHSILATEVRNLPSDLENYYKRYFNDRSKIVGFSEQYEQAFTDRKNQILAYDVRLTALKEQIDLLQSALEKSAFELTSQRNELDSQRKSGDISRYNSGVSSFNRNVTSYNQQIDRLTSLVAEFNDIVPKRNAIASEEQDLVKAIDSRETVPSRQ